MERDCKLGYFWKARKKKDSVCPGVAAGITQVCLDCWGLEGETISEWLQPLILKVWWYLWERKERAGECVQWLPEAHWLQGMACGPGRGWCGKQAHFILSKRNYTHSKHTTWADGMSGHSQKAAISVIKWCHYLMHHEVLGSILLRWKPFQSSQLSSSCFPTELRSLPKRGHWQSGWEWAACPVSMNPHHKSRRRLGKQ